MRERLRLEALAPYAIMDSQAEPGLDRITALAARLLDAPLAWLCLVGAEQLSFRSCHGVSLTTAPREAGFCHRVTAQRRTLVIPDTLADRAHAEVPLVNAPPHVRFYAGAPLLDAAGHAIGTLCVLDRAPRAAPAAEALQTLEALAATVMALLDAGLRERRVAAAGRRARLQADLLRLSFEAPDWPAMMRAMLARICAETGARAGAVWRLLPDRRLRMAEYHVAGPALPARFVSWCRTVRPLAGETLMGRAMLENRPFALDFTAADLTAMPVLQACREIGLRAILVQPVNLDTSNFALTLLFEHPPADLPALSDALSGLLGTLRPAMGRHATEEHQRLLGAALDAASDSVLVLQGGGDARAAPRIVYASASAARLTGWRVDEIVGATPALFIGRETGRRPLAAIRTAARAGRGIRAELHIRRRDGSLVWVETEISTLLDPDGMPTHWIAIQRDITRRRADALDAAERTRAHRLIFEDNPLPIWIFARPSLRFLAVNDAAVRQYGWSREEFLTLTVPDLYPPAERDLLSAGMATAPDACRQSGPVAHVTRSGQVRQVQIASQPIRFAAEPARIAVITDITDISRAQEVVAQAERLSTIGQITGGVAHDFNNLLTVVMLNIADALAEVPAGTALHGMLDSALYAASRGADLTSQLLSYARQQTLRPVPIVLRDRLTRLLPLLRRTLGPRHALRVEFSGAELTVEVDPTQLDSAVMNLVVNARDALPDGGAITLGLARRVVEGALPALPDVIAPGRYAAVSVADGGRGIPDALLRRVFDPFFTTKRPGEGSGLGLSMVYGFVRQSGGHVELRSGPGSGTRIELLLPERAAAPPALIAVPPAAAPGFAGAGRTVLVVEDQAAVLRVVSRHLTALGLRVLEVTGAREALALLQGGAPIDLLFTDLVLPGDIDGTALAECVLIGRPRLRVLLTSGVPGDQRGSPGRFGLLRKPYLRRDLIAALTQVFDLPPPGPARSTT